MGSWDGTLVIPGAGDALTDSILLGPIMGLLGAISGPSTPYTPAWGATSAPNIGSGTLDGSYKRAGKWGDATIRIIGAADTNWGSGSYSFGLPATWSLAVAGNVDLFGWAVVVDFSAVTYYLGAVAEVGSDPTKVRVRPHSQGNLTATSLVTLATSDTIIIRVIAELT